MFVFLLYGVGEREATSKGNNPREGGKSLFFWGNERMN